MPSHGIALAARKAPIEPASLSVFGETLSEAAATATAWCIMHSTPRILETCVSRQPGTRPRKHVSSIIRISALLFAIGLGLPLHGQGQPEILVSTIKDYPGGWEILAINPDTGEYRDVSNLPTADS